MTTESDALREVKRLRRELAAAEDRLAAIQEHGKAEAALQAAQARLAATQPEEEPAPEPTA